MPVGNNSRPAQPFSMRVKNSKGKANEGFTAAGLNALDVMSRDVVLAPARNDTVPIQEVSVQTACPCH